MGLVKTKKARNGYDTLGRDLMALSCMVTIVFTTSLAVDAFTPIKFTFLVIGLFFLYIRYGKFISSEVLSIRNLTFLVLVFFGHSLLLLFLNSYSISERLFGIQGRFFGFVSTWSLFLFGMAFYLAVRGQKLTLESIFSFVLLANLIVVAVFFAQRIGFAFVNFQNIYTVPSSTLGNPNFLAAFLAFSSLSGVYFLVSSERKLNFKTLFSFISISSSLYVVVILKSLQGPLGVGLGLLFLLILNCMRVRPRLAVLATITISIGSIPVIQGFFGHGLLGDRLEQSTLAVRSMYWAIAGRIGMDKPLYGHGFDTYLDNYREFRNAAEVEKFGTGIVSDSPHNLYLDFFVTGGFPYLLWAVIGSAYVLLVSFKAIRILGSSTRGTQFIFLVAMWCVLTVLALINPFQLAVNIWNVTIGSAIVGFYHQLIRDNKKSFSLQGIDSQTNFLIKLPLALSVIVFVNPAMAALPMVTEIRFRSAVESSDYKALRAVSTDWPFSGSRFVAISQGIVDSSLKSTPTPDLALARQLQDMIRTANDDAVAATRINANSFDLWRFIFYNHPDSLVKEQARANLIRLDPRDLSWQLGKP